MIKAEVNGGRVDIKEAEGNGIILMSELCCLVNAVCTSFCTAFCEDEPHGKEMASKMILVVADALATKEKRNERGADLEDDENADF